MGVDAQMFVRTKSDLSEQSVLKLAFDLSSAFGSEWFFITRPEEGYIPHHALHLIKEYQQDGPSLYPAEDEQFIEVELRTRYYGEGYERGDLPFIIMIAEWLEKRIDGEVWYGGDSSGILAEPFDKKARERLWKYFCEIGHKPYESAFTIRSTSAPICDFCQEEMIEYLWGAKRTGYRCPGCNGKIQTLDDGLTFQKMNEQDFR